MMMHWLRRVLRPSSRQMVPPPRPARDAAPPVKLARGTGRLPTVVGGEAVLDEWLDHHAVVTLLDLPLGEPLDRAEVEAVEARMLAELGRGDLEVPPFPASAARVLETVEKPRVDLNAVVQVLHWEPATVARVLATASSALYQQRALDDLRSAVLALGLEQVGSIAASVSVGALFDIVARAEFELYPALWDAAHRESLVIAFTASWLAQARGLRRYDRVFLRAVIGGVGRTLALRALAQPLLQGRCPAVPPLRVIAAASDSVHRRATDLAIARWDLPPSITHVIDPANDAERSIVDLVATLVELRRDPMSAPAALRARTLARELGLGASWLRVILREATDAAQRVDQLLGPAPLR